MDLQKSAECSVCLELFTEPSFLACGHCLRNKCLNATPRGITGELMKVTYPECRHESSVTDGGFPTNCRLRDIVSNLESAGFCNLTDCGSCGRKTPKSELFSCTTCQEEIGDAHEVLICSLCYVKAHRTHDIVDFNKATSRDVQHARDILGGHIDVYAAARCTRSQAARGDDPGGYAGFRGASDTRARIAQLKGEDASKDDIEAKLAQSHEHLTETMYSLEQMRIIIDRCGRSLMVHATQEDTASPAATAQPVADQPTTFANARAESRSDVAWDFGFDLYGGDYNNLLRRRSATPPASRALSPDFVFGFGLERPTAPAADLEERPSRARSPIAFRRPPPPTVTIRQGGSQTVTFNTPALHQQRQCLAGSVTSHPGVLGAENGAAGRHAREERIAAGSHYHTFAASSSPSHSGTSRRRPPASSQRHPGRGRGRVPEHCTHNGSLQRSLAELRAKCVAVPGGGRRSFVKWHGRCPQRSAGAGSGPLEGDGSAPPAPSHLLGAARQVDGLG